MRNRGTVSGSLSGSYNRGNFESVSSPLHRGVSLDKGHVYRDTQGPEGLWFKVSYSGPFQDDCPPGNFGFFMFLYS